MVYCSVCHVLNCVAVYVFSLTQYIIYSILLVICVINICISYVFYDCAMFYDMYDTVCCILHYILCIKLRNNEYIVMIIIIWTYIFQSIGIEFSWLISPFLIPSPWIPVLLLWSRWSGRWWTCSLTRRCRPFWMPWRCKALSIASSWRHRWSAPLKLLIKAVWEDEYLHYILYVFVNGLKSPIRKNSSMASSRTSWEMPYLYIYIHIYKHI